MKRYAAYTAAANTMTPPKILPTSTAEFPGPVPNAVEVVTGVMLERETEGVL